MKKTLFLLIVFISSFISSLKAQSYAGVWFENSSLPVRYNEAQVFYQGQSWVKNINGNLPLSDSVFFTPDNALELSYISATDGEWRVDIRYPRQENFRPRRESVLSLKIFVQSETTVDQLPAIALIQQDTIHSAIIPLKNYIQNYKTNTWLSVDIPLKEIQNIDFRQTIKSIRLFQYSKDGQEHSLYIDQIEFLPSRIPQNILTGVAVLSSVKAYEKHVDITWQLPLTPNIRYIKIYRSVDNKHFDAVAIRPIYARKYSDIIPKTGTVYYYKIAWVDYQYRESPFSEVKEAKPQKMSDEELLDMVQVSAINYFIDEAEFNSGMQLRDRSSQNAIVSVENTGIGMLALLVGVEKEIIPKEFLLKRLEKIVSFLERAERIRGAFPELLNGRTGRAIRRNESENVYVNLGSTASLIQGLMVVRQYFNQDNEEEEALRKKITEICEAVEWNSFVKPETSYLYTGWSEENGFDKGVPLSGQSELSVYILAMASPKFSIGLDAYRNAVTRPLQVIQKDNSILVDSISGQHVFDPFFDQVDSLGIPNPVDELNYEEVPYINGKVYYGLPLAIGDEHANLLKIMRGFVALNPYEIHDDSVDYYRNTENLVKIQHRESLENSSWNLLARGNPIAFVDSIGTTSVFAPAKGVAIYPFNPSLALKNIKNYYRNYSEMLWTEYGFVRAIDLRGSFLVYPENGIENALIVVMIENGKSGLIWNYFMKDPNVAKVVEELFKKKEDTQD